MKNKRTAPHAAQPQKQISHHDSITRAEGMLPHLLELEINGMRGKTPYAWLIARLRRQGFVRRQIERAIDDLLAAGRALLVAHDRRIVTGYSRMGKEIVRREVRLEVWGRK